ncbi:MAG: ABC transporter permease, partial [SAR324 cluster bacterium]|nr:ABC transporter permease [SAR324 cluster bacterium]
MIVMIIRRLIQSVIVMLTVGLIAFIMFRYVGDPIAQMVGQDTPIDVRERMREELGLNDAVIVQFLRFVGDTARGEFGISFRIGRPVNELILERLPATLELSLLAAAFALVVGIPMGIYTGLHPQHWLSKVFL